MPGCKIQEKIIETNQLSNDAFQGRIFRHNRLGRAQSVHGCTDDSAGVSRSLSDRIESFNSWRLAICFITHDANVCTAPAFRTDQRCLRQESALPAIAHDW